MLEMLDKRNEWNQEFKSVGREGYTVKMIIIHGMATTDKTLVPKIWNERPASAHYGIKNQDIEMYVVPEDTGWHAANWSVNLRSIGVEHLNSTGEPTWYFSQETLDTSVQFVANLLKKYGLTVNDIHKHNEFVATECPQSLADAKNWENYLNKIADITGDVLEIQPKLKPDGLFDNTLVKKIQHVLGISEDGVIRSQPESNKGIFENQNYEGVEFVADGIAKGSSTVKAMKKSLGMEVDGFFDKSLVETLQMRYETAVNGSVSAAFVNNLKGQLNTCLEYFEKPIK